ncbi:MAG: YdeI/OmpD-associated family protein [Vallitaleaceae bacterium]|nr:YdeI/OmpD-associated family protein [Vallitaleaceae bacterium]
MDDQINNKNDEFDNIEIKAGVVHEVPQDIEVVLRANVDLLNRWNKLTPIQRNEWICWVTIVKTPETREEHIKRLVEDILEDKRKPCCWPGCPHRNPNAAKYFK